ncbi:MAG: hypothetical protein K9G76_05375 [Bacteroidales bacterium]|nr:hypothetical protein [Bacteroidales bacterium]MCF8403110.1 hypothetical protein [Bacteroidales bacterium]
MKKCIYLLLSILLFVGCGYKKMFEVVEVTHPDGSPQIVKFYNNESKEKLLKEVRYWDNGNKSIEGSYKNGLREGIWTAWHSNGTIWSTGEYKKGIEHGMKTVYHDNGQKYYEGSIMNEERTGIWRFWDKDGKLIKEINYEE